MGLMDSFKRLLDAVPTQSPVGAQVKVEIEAVGMWWSDIGIWSWTCVSPGGLCHQLAGRLALRDGCEGPLSVSDT